MTHDPIEELLGAYALNAVSEEEARAVEAHLETCPRCRAEVDQHREVAAHLAESGPAPDGLWDAIATSIEDAAPPPLRLVVDDGSRTRPVPPARRFRAGRLVAAAAAVLAIVALSVSSVRQQQRIDDLEQASGVAAAANEAFADPDARIAELAGPDGDALVRAAVLDDGTGYVLAENLDALDEGIYQLWGATVDGAVVSLGPMGSAPGVVAFPGDPAITQLLISVEQAPVAQPTTDPIAAGDLA